MNIVFSIITVYHLLVLASCKAPDSTSNVVNADLTKPRLGLFTNWPLGRAYDTRELSNLNYAFNRNSKIVWSNDNYTRGLDKLFESEMDKWVTDSDCQESFDIEINPDRSHLGFEPGKKIAEILGSSLLYKQLWCFQDTDLGMIREGKDHADEIYETLISNEFRKESNDTIIDLQRNSNQLTIETMNGRIRPMKFSMNVHHLHPLPTNLDVQGTMELLHEGLIIDPSFMKKTDIRPKTWTKKPVIASSFPSNPISDTLSGEWTLEDSMLKFKNHDYLQAFSIDRSLMLVRRLSGNRVKVFNLRLVRSPVIVMIKRGVAELYIQYYANDAKNALITTLNLRN